MVKEKRSKHRKMKIHNTVAVLLTIKAQVHPQTKIKIEYKNGENPGVYKSHIKLNLLSSLLNQMRSLLDLY